MQSRGFGAVLDVELVEVRGVCWAWVWLGVCCIKKGGGNVEGGGEEG